MAEKLLEYKKDLNLNGKNLQVANVEQPSLIAYYDQITVEIHAYVKYLEMIEKDIRGTAYKKIRDSASRDYTEAAIQRLIDSDGEYLKVHSLLIDIEELYETSKSIVKCFEQRSYSLNNLVKIHEKELHNITVHSE